MGIFSQEGGAIQGFETPTMILGLLNKILHLGMGQWGEMWVLASEGVRGMPGVSPTKRRGTIQGFENPIRILGFLKKIPPLWGTGGG